MLDINFSNFSHKEFEEIALDIIERKDNITFIRSSDKNDGGVDGYYIKDGRKTVIQAKNFIKSIISHLRKEMKEERKKMENENPSRYLLITSYNLTIYNRKEIKKIMHPFIKNDEDIYGYVDIKKIIEDLLNINNELLCNHPKLWMQRSDLLQRVVNTDIFNYTISKDEAQAKAGLYVHLASMAKAGEILDKMNSVIISGSPGVGKTCMGHMLLVSYCLIGWKIFIVPSPNDVFKALDLSSKMIFLVDDFLGSNLLEANILSEQEKFILRLINIANNNKNLKVIFTTRTHIIQNAERESEILFRNHIVELGDFNRREKVEILFNHLSTLIDSQDKINEFVKSEYLFKIIDHENFIPRVIELMTDVRRINDITPKEYPIKFIHALDKPIEIWKTIFENKLDDRCRHFLISLFFFSNNPKQEILRVEFESTHKHICKEYNIQRGLADYEHALCILKNDFIKISSQNNDHNSAHKKQERQDVRIKYMNPSFSDWMSDYLNKPPVLIVLAKSAQSIDWAERLWLYGNEFIKTELKEFSLAFLGISEKFSRISLSKDIAEQGNVYTDLSYVRLLELILEWLFVSKSPRFAEVAKNMISQPPLDWNMRFGDLTNALAILHDLSCKGRYSKLPISTEFSLGFESLIVSYLYQGSLNDIENFMCALMCFDEFATDKMLDAAKSTFSNNIQSIRNDDLINYSYDRLENIYDMYEAFERDGIFTKLGFSSSDFTEIKMILGIVYDGKQCIESDMEAEYEQMHGNIKTSNDSAVFIPNKDLGYEKIALSSTDSRCYISLNDDCDSNMMSNDEIYSFFAPLIK